MIASLWQKASIPARILSLLLGVGSICVVVILLIGLGVIQPKAVPLPTVSSGMSDAEIKALRYPASAWSPPLIHLMEAGPKILPSDFEVGISPPPANDSPTTQHDIEQLLDMQRDERTPEQIKLITKENEISNPFQVFIWHDLLNPNDKPVLELLFAALWDVNYFLLREKSKYQRPRPTQLSASLTSVIPVPPHSSYPNGHAGQTFATALILGAVNPAKEYEYLKLALAVGHRREIAGIHYPSDTKAAQILAQNVTDALLKTEKISKLLDAARHAHPEYQSQASDK